MSEYMSGNLICLLLVKFFISSGLVSLIPSNDNLFWLVEVVLTSLLMKTFREILSDGELGKKVCS